MSKLIKPLAGYNKKYYICRTILKTNKIMKNQTLEVVQLPQEVEQLAQNVSVEKRTEVQTVLNHVFNGVSKMREQLDAVTVADENDKASMKVANTIRLNVRQVRLDAEKTFDAKRAEVQAQMIGFKTEDALWLKAKQTMQILTKEIEEVAKIKETTAERIAAERKELETQTRMTKVSKFNPELQRSEFENMSAEMFEMFLTGIEKAYNDKIEAEAKAEAERLAAIEADRLERERIKAENERLAKEAAEKEKQLQAERAEAARKQKEIEDAAKEQQRIADEKAAKERAESDRLLKIEKAKQAALEAELKAKADKEAAELKAKQEAEKQAKLEAEKAAKAPRKEKLTKWVESFQIPTFENDEVAANITARFNSFKKWAKSEITNI